MSAHFVTFLKRYPATFADVQSTIDRLNLPLRINRDGKFETAFSLEAELGEYSALISMELINVCDLPEIFRSLAHGDYNLSIDFRYGSDWADGCGSLIICYALAADFDARIYDDFMGNGFISLEQARAAIDSWLEDNL